MGKLTGTIHGDAANNLMSFYQEQSEKLEATGAYFMAAVAMALAVDSALLAYLLVEFGEENGGELQIPDTVAFGDLIEAARDVDVLNAPIEVPPHLDGDVEAPKHIANEVVDAIRAFRNLIHPARALKESFDPRSFSAEQLQELKDKYWSVVYSLVCYL